MTKISKRSARLLTTSVLAAGWLVACGARAADKEAPAGQWKSDARMQAAFDRIAVAGDAEGRRAAFGVMTVPVQDRPETVRQLVVYAARAGGMQPAQVFAAVSDERNLSDQEIVAAIIPMLELADGQHRTQAINVLGQYENRSASRPPDFSLYRDHLAAELRAGRRPPPGLVRYMYDSAPGVALLAMLRAHPDRRPESLKPVLWAEHVVSDTLWKQQHGFLARDKVEPAAKQELEKLSRDGRWWVRLYVAAIMRQHEAFHEKGIAKRLGDDPHSLVTSFVSDSQP
jgi:hypothetical protein